MYQWDSQIACKAELEGLTGNCKLFATSHINGTFRSTVKTEVTEFISSIVA